MTYTITIFSQKPPIALLTLQRDFSAAVSFEKALKEINQQVNPSSERVYRIIDFSEVLYSVYELANILESALDQQNYLFTDPRTRTVFVGCSSVFMSALQHLDQHRIGWRTFTTVTTLPDAFALVHRWIAEYTYQKVSLETKVVGIDRQFKSPLKSYAAI